MALEYQDDTSRSCRPNVQRNKANLCNAYSRSDHAVSQEGGRRYSKEQKGIGQALFDSVVQDAGVPQETGKVVLPYNTEAFT
jgi:hypothetical protein